MDCRPDCGACCIAPSISTPLPGLPAGKAAGFPCPHLDERFRCRLFGKAERPACCSGLQPSPQMCGEDRQHALNHLAELERLTCPSPSGISPPSATELRPARKK
jgi:hypothetical protein